MEAFVPLSTPPLGRPSRLCMVRRERRVISGSETWNPPVHPISNFFTLGGKSCSALSRPSAEVPCLKNAKSAPSLLSSARIHPPFW
jgi:hypothetical protein